MEDLQRRRGAGIVKLPDGSTSTLEDLVKDSAQAGLTDRETAQKLNKLLGTEFNRRNIIYIREKYNIPAGVKPGHTAGTFNWNEETVEYVLNRTWLGCSASEIARELSEILKQPITTAQIEYVRDKYRPTY